MNTLETLPTVFEFNKIAVADPEGLPADVVANPSWREVDERFQEITEGVDVDDSEVPLLERLNFDETSLVKACLANPSSCLRTTLETYRQVYRRRIITAPLIGSQIFGTRNARRTGLDLRFTCTGETADAMLAVQTFSPDFNTTVGVELSGDRADVFAQTYQAGKAMEIILAPGNPHRDRVLHSLAEKLWVTNISLLCDPEERPVRDAQAKELQVRDSKREGILYGSIIPR